MRMRAAVATTLLLVAVAGCGQSTKESIDAGAEARAACLPGNAPATDQQNIDWAAPPPEVARIFRENAARARNYVDWLGPRIVAARKAADADAQWGGLQDALTKSQTAAVALADASETAAASGSVKAAREYWSVALPELERRVQEANEATIAACEDVNGVEPTNDTVR
jgi:hypothetical protein